jgi:DsbC/DsbD-like thiol-disulfide interchange protein
MLWQSIITVLACSMLAVSADAMEKPYRVSLVGDSYDGAAWTTGVRIEMDEGWKTYWRMPGEAGVPPEFSWKTSVPADIEVLYPLPGRYEDASGETVGYKHEVIFPVTVKAGSARELKLDLSLFFAVCRDICIPAAADASINLGSSVNDPAGAAAVERAIATVPRPGKSVTGGELVTVADRTVLKLSLDHPVDDIFIESAGSAYFKAPRFENGGREALLEIGNVSDPAKLSGQTLKLTYARNGQGLEQILKLP